MSNNIAVEFKRMFNYIAFGLREKLQMTNPEEYSHGLLLRQGINMFCALALKYSNKTGDALNTVMTSLTETKIICDKFTLPVKDWFLGWDDSVIDKIKDESFYEIGALVYVDKSVKRYELTIECEDYLDASEDDLTAIDEKEVYANLKKLEQEDYVAVRKFIIEHVLLKSIERKIFLLEHPDNELIREILGLAYENVPQGMYVCPNCGWTLSYIGEKPVCCHHSCEKNNMVKNKDVRFVDKDYDFRLKKGVARYIAYPGRAEIEIDKMCKELDVDSYLWPDLDRYDISISFKNGKRWGVDAKTYKNPRFLGISIANDNAFQSAEVDFGFYVIPDDIINITPRYLKICNSYLKNNKFQCLSMSAFKKKLKESVKNE